MLVWTGYQNVEADEFVLVGHDPDLSLDQPRIILRVEQADNAKGSDARELFTNTLVPVLNTHLSLPE